MEFYIMKKMNVILITALATLLGSIGQAHLERAIDNVERHFDFVGHAAHFDRSMAKISAILGQPYVPRGRENQSPAPAETLVDQFPQDILDSLTAVDQQFVEWIEQRFFA